MHGIGSVQTSAAKTEIQPEEYTTDTHIWKQDKRTVVLFIKVPSGARGSEMVVQYSGDTQMLTILHGSDVVLRKELKYKISVSEDKRVGG